MLKNQSKLLATRIKKKYSCKHVPRAQFLIMSRQNSNLCSLYSDHSKQNSVQAPVWIKPPQLSFCRHRIIFTPARASKEVCSSASLANWPVIVQRLSVLVKAPRSGRKRRNFARHLPARVVAVICHRIGARVQSWAASPPVSWPRTETYNCSYHHQPFP